MVVCIYTQYKLEARVKKANIDFIFLFNDFCLMFRFTVFPSMIHCLYCYIC